MTLKLRFWAHSEVGRIRKNNQDAGYASPTMLVVADGMGGAAEGDLASAVAITHVAEVDHLVSGAEMIDYMADVVNDANDRLAALVDNDPTLDGMGTTFCGVAFDGEQFGMAHIGDSRMYRLRDGQLEQLTHDHSWVQSLIDEGRLTPEQAATHPHRSLILKVLNGQPSPQPDYELIDAREGDRMLLCSDGLSGLITDDHIRRLMTSIEDLSELSDALARAANQGGGHDNITVVLADVVADEVAEAEPMVVGSAVERDIPPLTPKSSAESDASIARTTTADFDPEKHRYAPQESKKLGSVFLAVGGLWLAVIVGACWYLLSYSTTQYFIAESDGRIAIYNGMPGSLLGWEMNHLEERRSTLVTDLPRFYQRLLGNTIASPSLDEAKKTANELERLAKRCAAVRSQRGVQPTPTPTPSPTPSESLPTASPTSDDTSSRPKQRGIANYPTVLAPVTPTALEEVDPEAC